MKRMISLLSVAALMFTLCACSLVQPTVTIDAPTTSVLNLMPDGSIIIGEPTGQQTSSFAAQPPTTEARIDWIIDIYNKVYNNTKADSTFLGSDSIVFSDISLDGVKNAGLDSIVYSVLNTVYTPQVLPLPPYSETNPFPMCIFTVEDAASATWKDLGNGQAEIYIVPKPSVNSHLGEGQGKMFNVINDITQVFDYLPAFAYSWSEGDTASNVTTTYDGGYCRVVYDRVKMKMVSAEYVMKLSMAITNYELLFMSHNAGVSMTYTQTFPAVN